MAKRKCVICGNEIETNDIKLVDYKNRKAHEKCFNNFIKIQTTTKTNQLKEKASQKKSGTKTTSAKKDTLSDFKSEEEFQERKDLIDYLKKLLQTEEINAKVLHLLQTYRNKYKWSDANIKKALVWFYELKTESDSNAYKKTLYPDKVGILPYIYDEAMRYYQTIEEAEKRNNDVDISQLYQSKRIKIKHKEIEIPQIDISKIGGE